MPETFAEGVARVLREHGCSFRSQRQRTGLPHSTVAGWVNDQIPPSADGVTKFAQGFGLDINEWRVLAGHPPIHDRNPQRALETVLEHADELTYEPELEAFDIRGYHGAENLTENDLEAVNRVMRALISQRRKKQGME